MKSPLQYTDEIISEIIGECLRNAGLTPEINNVFLVDYAFEKGMGRLAPSPWDVNDGYDVEMAVFTVTVFDIEQEENIDDWLDYGVFKAFLIDELDASVALNNYEISFEEDYAGVDKIHTAIAEWVKEEREAEEMEEKAA